MLKLDYPFRAAIFDLDGVIVDTAKYHYLAWKRLAQELGFEFTAEDNEQLKGISRKESLEALLKAGGIHIDTEEMDKLSAKKNTWYLEYIAQMTASEILPGAKEVLIRFRKKGIKTALGSASKNAPMILRYLEIDGLFDAVVDGNNVSKTKPDPEVFLIAAHKLGVLPRDCVVFEDACAGIEAAKSAGMMAVGIGDPKILTNAKDVIPGLYDLRID